MSKLASCKFASGKFGGAGCLDGKTNTAKAAKAAKAAKKKEFLFGNLGNYIECFKLSKLIESIIANNFACVNIHNWGWMADLQFQATLGYGF